MKVPIYRAHYMNDMITCEGILRRPRCMSPFDDFNPSNANGSQIFRVKVTIIISLLFSGKYLTYFPCFLSIRWIKTPFGGIRNVLQKKKLFLTVPNNVELLSILVVWYFVLHYLAASSIMNPVWNWNAPENKAYRGGRLKHSNFNVIR